MSLAVERSRTANAIGQPDRAAFDQWFDAMYAPHEWPADARFVLSWYEDLDWVKEGDSAPPTSAHIRLDDREVVWEAVVANGSDRKVWAGVAPRSEAGLTEQIIEKQAKREAEGKPYRTKRDLLPWTRGNKAACYPLAGVWLELDVRGQFHKKANVPPVEYIDWLIDVFPLRPTVKIFTGGGFHLWFAFAELLADTDEEEFVLSLLAGWLKDRKANSHAWILANRPESEWTMTDEKTGELVPATYDLDDGVFNRDRVLRPGGSLIGKGGDLSPIQTVEYNPHLRYTVDDFEVLSRDTESLAIAQIAAWLDGRQLEGAEVKRLSGSRTDLEYRELPEDSSEWKPGDRLAYKLPVSILLADVFGCRRSSGRDRWDVPREDGTYSVGSAATNVGLVYTGENGRTVRIDDGIERVRVFGRTAGEALNMEVKSTPATSFTLIANVFCGEEGTRFSLAGKVAVAFENDVDALVDLLATDPTPEQLAAAAAERMPKKAKKKPATRARVQTLSEARAAAAEAASARAEDQPSAEPSETSAPVSMLDRLRPRAAPVQPPAPPDLERVRQKNALQEAARRRAIEKPAA